MGDPEPETKKNCHRVPVKYALQRKAGGDEKQVLERFSCATNLSTISGGDDELRSLALAPSLGWMRNEDHTASTIAGGIGSLAHVLSRIIVDESKAREDVREKSPLIEIPIFPTAPFSDVRSKRRKATSRDRRKEREESEDPIPYGNISNVLAILRDHRGRVQSKEQDERKRCVRNIPMEWKSPYPQPPSLLPSPFSDVSNKRRKATSRNWRKEMEESDDPIPYGKVMQKGTVVEDRRPFRPFKMWMRLFAFVALVTALTADSDDKMQGSDDHNPLQTEAQSYPGKPVRELSKADSQNPDLLSVLFTNERIYKATRPLIPMNDSIDTEVASPFPLLRLPSPEPICERVPDWGLVGSGSSAGFRVGPLPLDFQRRRQMYPNENLFPKTGGDENQVHEMLSRATNPSTIAGGDDELRTIALAPFLDWMRK
ncbi:unnamed protein product [Darwinula stevensoni]|uniref:Uncharacterized protein n=1 Tax=Darwinula stevensoni TaxID=69355 RepID=A0A7R9A9M8_9CRUS|nr:unnamed protein product [Darwinula stevensoni]CAG0897553.1 unnamed protein product [Darwinula stevensoni]